MCIARLMSCSKPIQPWEEWNDLGFPTYTAWILNIERILSMYWSHKVALTFWWDLKVVIYSLRIGSLLMKVGGNFCHLRFKQRKQYQFFKKLIFRVKMLIFGFESSQTLNLSVEESNWCLQKSCRPIILYPMIQLGALVHKRWGVWNGGG